MAYSSHECSRVRVVLEDSFKVGEITFWEVRGAKNHIVLRAGWFGWVFGVRGGVVVNMDQAK